jgi:signal transduction histidine kinase
MKQRSLQHRLVVLFAVWVVALLIMVLFAMHFFPRDSTWAWRIHYGMPIGAGLAFMATGVFIVRRGLSPFFVLRERLAEVRDGRKARLEGDYPIEVTPLVDDLNLLLGDRENRVARAAARAGDLAHGLKTPLAVLMQDIGRADAAGQHELATSMRCQVERMRRQIDSHLAQTRATASGASGASANVGEALAGLVRTMERLYSDRGLAISIDASPELTVRVPAEDLEEMIGNLLDNACKWAASRVTLTAICRGSSVIIHVDDDGAGLADSMREQVLDRGVRADEAAPGSGLGLAIVRDLADAYGGSIVLDRSSAGGLRATLTVPGHVKVAPTVN